jgi:hypothetical protein
MLTHPLVRRVGSYGTAVISTAELANLPLVSRPGRELRSQPTGTAGCCCHSRPLQGEPWISMTISQM